MIAPLFLLSFLLTIVGLVLLVRGWRGVPSLSEPRCAKCGYDLRGAGAAPPAVCSECGADLAKPGAVRWGDYRRQPKLLWAGGALLVLPAVLITAALMTKASGVSTARRATNRQLIASLSKTANQPWDWQELERRHGRGELSPAEVAQAVDQLIASLTGPGAGAGPSSVRGPLPWSRQFLQRAVASGDVTKEQYLRLARAYYGTQPAVSYSPLVREGAPLVLKLEYGGAWNLPDAQFVKAVRAIKSPDGSELPAVALHDHPAATGRVPPNPDFLSATGVWPVEVKVTHGLPPGEHTLTVVVDAAVLKEGSVPRAVQDKPGQAAAWPKGLARWTAEVPVKVTVVPPGGATVALVTDPARNPARGVTIKGVRVTRAEKKKRLAVEVDFGRPPVPVSVDVVAKVGGREHTVGSYVVTSTQTTSTEHAAELESLPPDVKRVDVVLRPNPRHAENVPGITEIWGGEIERQGVLLERYDLEAGDAGSEKGG